MKIRLKDIAEMTGVSVGAVSQVLNNKPIRMSEDKKEEIRELARKNNYSPNIAAKSLVSNKSNTIGLVVPDINNPFFANLAQLIEKNLREQGYILILVNSDDKFTSEVELIRLLINRGVDALILIFSNEAYANEKKLQSLLKEINVPFVLADRAIATCGASQVAYDNVLGGYLATNFLLENGHRNIGAMMSFTNSTNAMYRHQGYLKALKEYDITPKKEWEVATQFQFEDSYEKAEQLLKNKEITGIVAGNDLIALGIIKRAKEMGIAIPDELSLVGYDNIFLNDLLEIGLTSVEQNVSDLAQATVGELQNVMKGSKGQQIQLNPKLVVRQSVKNINE